MLQLVKINVQQDRENERLCERLKASDRRVFATLFEEMNEALLRYAWRITKDEAVAQDLVQDAFLKLWQSRENLDAQRSVRGLLYTIARNLALNHNRDHGGNDHVSLDGIEEMRNNDVAADTQMDATQLENQLRQWVSEMPERRREAFELSRFDGLSHDEISGIMDLSPSTVNRHIVMALQTLREKMNEFAPEWKV